MVTFSLRRYSSIQTAAFRARFASLVIAGSALIAVSTSCAPARNESAHLAPSQGAAIVETIGAAAACVESLAATTAEPYTLVLVDGLKQLYHFFVDAFDVLHGMVVSHRIRISDPRERRIVAEALGHSATFRALVERLERTSVVVYVSPGHCNGSVSACLQYVGAASGLTYVRATIDAFVLSPSVIAALIAHELRHALEIADAGVASATAWNAFYRDHAYANAGGYETDKAAATGLRVLQEYDHAASATARVRRHVHP